MAGQAGCCCVAYDVGTLAEAGLIRVDAPRHSPATGPDADPGLLREIVEQLREI